MILKFSEIKNLAVFKNFSWDHNVKDPQGNIIAFKQVNVLYGRNYSGKTTLSRIVRAFETGVLSNKYINPSFSIETENGILTEKDYSDKPILVRVFNEDFVRENLRFVVDPEAAIAPFAVLGENNERIEARLKIIREELGENNPDRRTGLYEKKQAAEEALVQSAQRYKSAKTELEKKMALKATDRKYGIKYNPSRYGNQNYNIRNLEADIEEVSAENYIPLDDADVKLREQLLVDREMNKPREIKQPQFLLLDLAERVREICSREIGTSQKIQELMNDVVLEEWVRQGIDINQNREVCAFCGAPLKDDRWKELFAHFDEDSKRLSRDINSIELDIENEIKKIKDGLNIDVQEFYPSFRNSITDVLNEYQNISGKYISELLLLREYIAARKKSLHHPVECEIQIQNLDFTQVYQNYTYYRAGNIEYTKDIASRRRTAQTDLRLNEVYNFVKTIAYDEAKENIRKLEVIQNSDSDTLDKIKKSIDEKQKEITDLLHQQNDEEKGAQKVNEYLHSFFGHQYINLVAKSRDDGLQKQVYFEVERNGTKAFHLSEGERSLIAFCYFVAKLEDTDTAGTKPIIWIDDPICSLDSNHIYFIYTIITQRILARDLYEQLFITTHNLLFLKYLRILSINKHSTKKIEKGNNRGNYVIERHGDESVIKLMPKYLKEHGTEFNHWFQVVYQCAHIENVTDENIYLFESFGNSARKFLETYLYYKYPDNENLDNHLKRFFGNDFVPPIFINKLSDELSHAQGDLESHELPFDEPEIRDAAKLIIQRLEENDKDQFDALCKSIGQKTKE